MRFITANRKSYVALCAMGLLASLSAFNSEEEAATSERSGNSVPVNSFTNFESAHVHPIEMTPDGTRLLAVNTANNSLEVFTLGTAGMVHFATIPVGLDPVTVRARTSNEAWVVNTVSDEISIVDLTLKATIRSLATEKIPRSGEVATRSGEAGVRLGEVVVLSPGIAPGFDCLAPVSGEVVTDTAGLRVRTRQ